MTPGTEVTPISRNPDAVDLFMFSASAWLLHRIHYDVPFTTGHDGHPGLLIHGPMQGTFMVQTALRFLGRGSRLRTITYRHLAPAYLGDPLTCGGAVIEEHEDSVVLELWIRKDDETVTTQGTATFGLEDVD